MEAKHTLSKTEQDQRARILMAAASAFFGEGYSKASVDKIAATARVSKRSIYEIYPSKAALFEATVRNALAAGHSRREAVTMESPHEFATRLYAGFADPATFGLFRAQMVAGDLFPQLADELHAYRHAMGSQFARYLESLVPPGVTLREEPTLPGSRFGSIIVGGLQRFFEQQIPTAPELEQWIADAVDLFFNGYRDHIVEGTKPASSAFDVIARPIPEGRALRRINPTKLSRLVDAAMNTFLESGYHGAVVEHIVHMGKSSKATIYRQFGNKEGLFRYIVAHATFKSSRAKLNFEIHDTVDQTIISLARQALDWHLDPENILMHRVLIQDRDVVPDLAHRFYNARISGLGRALERALTAHGWPLPDASAIRIFYTLATYATRFLTTPELPDADLRDRCSREAALLFLHGFGFQPKSALATTM